MNYQPLNFSPLRHNMTHFFSLAEAPVRYEYPISGNFDFYHGKKVIINKDRNEPISIVPSNFYAMPNIHAFDLGVEIFELMFGATPSVHKEYTKSNKTEYAVDLVSKDVKIVFKNQGFQILGYNSQSERNSEFHNLSNSRIEFISKEFHDEYHPFIRVANALHSRSSFYIEMGYYRYACSNGMLLGRKTKMTFKHSYMFTDFSTIRKSALDYFRINQADIFSFAEKLWKLLSTYIPRAEMRKVSFDLFEKEIIKKDVEERQNLQVILSDLVNKYVQEIGENLNAALNIATDFSKYLEKSGVPKSSLQSIPVSWMNRVVKKEFNIQSYLENLSEIEIKVMNTKVKQTNEEF